MRICYFLVDLSPGHVAGHSPYSAGPKSPKDKELASDHARMTQRLVFVLRRFAVDEF